MSNVAKEDRIPIMFMEEFDRCADEIRALLRGKPALRKKAKCIIFMTRKRNRNRVRGGKK